MQLINEVMIFSMCMLIEWAYYVLCWATKQLHRLLLVMRLKVKLAY